MPHHDYLGDLPPKLRKFMNRLSGDFSDDWSVLHELLDEIDQQISNRYEIAISLVDLFDIVEIAVQRSMVPPQKTEFAWRIYMDYFRILTKIVQASVAAPDAAGIPGTVPYLLAKMKYEIARRWPIIEKGGTDEFEAIIKPIRHLL